MEWRRFDTRARVPHLLIGEYSRVGCGCSARLYSLTLWPQLQQQLRGLCNFIGSHSRVWEVQIRTAPVVSVLGTRFSAFAKHYDTLAQSSRVRGRDQLPSLPSKTLCTSIKIRAQFRNNCARHSHHCCRLLWPHGGSAAGADLKANIITTIIVILLPLIYVRQERPIDHLTGVGVLAKPTAHPFELGRTRSEDEIKGSTSRVEHQLYNI